MGKLPLVEIRDAVLEPFRVMLAARRAVLRRRRHGRRASRAAAPRPETPVFGVQQALAIGDAVLCDD